MTGAEGAFNFRRIDARLTTSGLLSPEQLASLGGEGYEAVVDLLPAGDDWAVADEPRIVRDQGIEYVAIPVDFAAPTHDDLERFYGVMDALQGRTVHVHCAANYRVSVFYGLYALARGQWTREQADALVHGLWDPGEYPAWASFIADARDGGGEPA
ncbi:MAG: hypothetical protein FJW95_06005 [Actinobacteria bacterium]|nr:hypothetical protein [Actinomycetota bacterium]